MQDCEHAWEKQQAGSASYLQLLPERCFHVAAGQRTAAGSALGVAVPAWAVICPGGLAAGRRQLCCCCCQRCPGKPASGNLLPSHSCSCSRRAQSLPELLPCSCCWWYFPEMPVWAELLLRPGCLWSKRHQHLWQPAPRPDCRHVAAEQGSPLLAEVSQMLGRLALCCSAGLHQVLMALQHCSAPATLQYCHADAHWVLPLRAPSVEIEWPCEALGHHQPELGPSNRQSPDWARLDFCFLQQRFPGCRYPE